MFVHVRSANQPAITGVALCDVTFYRFTNDLQAVKWQKHERTVAVNAPQCPKEYCFLSAVLILGYTDPLIDFRGSVNLDGGKN